MTNYMYYPRCSKFPFHNDDKFAPVSENQNYNYYKHYPVKVYKFNDTKNKNRCIIL